MILTNLKVLLHHLTPKFYLTKLAGCFASKNLGSITTLAIKTFANHYNINMNEAKNPNFNYYATFNDFFTRELAEGARSIVKEPNSIAMPVDGTMAQLGDITYGRLIAAKGQDYSLRDLVGGDKDLASTFKDGKFACIYLSPKNYHRIHMPCEGVLRKMIFVPGKFYSVNPTYVANIDNLFTKNERAVCIFDTPFGPMAMILVGATIVGSIATSWAGRVYPKNRTSTSTFNYQKKPAIKLNKGEEMGQFYLGSTVILLFAKDAINFNDQVCVGEEVTLGTLLANANANATSTLTLPHTENASEAESKQENPQEELTEKVSANKNETLAKSESKSLDESKNESPYKPQNNTANEDSSNQSAPKAPGAKDATKATDKPTPQRTTNAMSEPSTKKSSVKTRITKHKTTK